MNSKAQLKINKVNNRPMTYPGHTKEDAGVMRSLFCKQVSFEHLLAIEGADRCCTAYITRKIIPNFRSIKIQTITLLLLLFQDKKLHIPYF